MTSRRVNENMCSATWIQPLFVVQCRTLKNILYCLGPIRFLFCIAWECTWLSCPPVCSTSPWRVLIYELYLFSFFYRLSIQRIKLCVDFNRFTLRLSLLDYIYQMPYFVSFYIGMRYIHVNVKTFIITQMPPVKSRCELWNKGCIL